MITIPPNRMHKAILIFILLLWLTQSAMALIPERRRLFEERKENVYMVIPAIASMPGAGVFAGVLGSFSNIYGSGIDAAVTRAQTIGGDSDIHVSAYALREIPLYIPGLTVEYWFGDIKLNEFNSYIPGRDSPDFTIPYTGEFKYYFLRPALRLWQRRLSFNYNLVFFKGYAVNEEGQDAFTGSHSASGSITLDLTDDWIDPRIGIRGNYRFKMNAPKKSVLGEDDEADGKEPPDTKTYDLAAYIPLSEAMTMVLFQQWFDTPNGAEAQGFGGGSIPLRGYPGGRWSDKFGLMQAIEMRYTQAMNIDFDILLAQGRLDGIQYAGFYEVGQVSPEKDERLRQDLHQDYGVGVRALIDAIILRFDVAFRPGGAETHLTIDHAF